MGRGVKGVVVVLCVAFFWNSASARVRLSDPVVPLDQYPLISDIIETAPFRDVRAAYQANNIPLAITKLQELQTKTPKTEAEKAAYLLGELYLMQAERGEAEAISQAMVSYQDAVRAYPKSEYLLWGYLQIGKIYARQNLFYEAVGSFTRVLERPHSDHFLWRAKLGLAKTYRGWAKWFKAKIAYEETLSQSLPPNARDEAMLGYADVLYQLGQFEKAYRYYKGTENMAYRSSDPHAFFQFGEAAYRIGRLDEAKTLLLDFYNVHPHASYAAVALIRAGALSHIKDQPSQSGPLSIVTPNLDSLSDTFYNMAARTKEDNESFHLGRILLSLEALKECGPWRRGPNTLSLTENLHVCDMPLVRQAFLRSPQWGALHIEAIRTDALNLLDQSVPSTTAQGILLEVISLLEHYRAVYEMAEIEASLLAHLPSVSPYRLDIQNILEKTIAKDLAALSDPLPLITLYHTYPSVFTDKMLRGDVGFILGIGHLDIGLISKGAELLKPVAENYRHPSSDEALYRLGQAFLQLDENEPARRALEQYQHRLPTARHRVLTALGDIAFRKNQIEEAISLYQDWLKHYPQRSDRGEVYIKISDVHRFRNDFDSEIKVYEEWIRQDPKSADPAYMRLSDAYFQSGQYDKAAALYRWILDQAKEGKGNVEWIQFRLGQAYASMGNHEGGQRLFRIIARNGRDPLIRKMAEENLAAAVQPPLLSTQKEAFVN